MPRTPDPKVSRPRPTVAVLGGGIAGLSAAWHFSGGASGPSSDTPSIIVFETDERLGGKLRADTFAGPALDTGPDSFLGTRPEALALCHELGLDRELVPVAASGASLWSRGRPRPLPSAMVSGVPTKLGPLMRSGILGPGASMRVALDLVFPRPAARGPIGDRAFGPLVAQKLGQGVVDSLVDPLMGGIHAGTVADMSTAAVNPLLLAVAQQRGSFIKSLRRANQREAPTRESQENHVDAETSEPSPPTSMFWSLTGGVASLVERLSAQLAQRSVSLRTSCRVEALVANPNHRSPWVIETSSGPVVVDGIVVALPAVPAGELLTPHDTDAATLLAGIEYASVAVVSLTYPKEALGDSLGGTGMLVPRDCPPPGAMALEGPLMVTAISFLENKWPHLAREGQVLLRASVGRIDDERFTSMSDEELIDRITAELGSLVGVQGPPSAAMVTRWPGSFPQYRVHHLLRVTGIEAAVKRLPVLAVAGAAYRGIGIPACIASGRDAAQLVLDELSGVAEVPGPGR